MADFGPDVRPLPDLPPEDWAFMAELATVFDSQEETSAAEHSLLERRRLQLELEIVRKEKQEKESERKLLDLEATASLPNKSSLQGNVPPIVHDDAFEALRRDTGSMVSNLQ